MTSDKYDLLDGEPKICNDLLIWAQWFDQSDTERIVALDGIGDIHVSTVFLGLDHSFGRGEPLLFETMIFGGEHDGYQERYSTRKAALDGHVKALALVTPEGP